jgi:hypothetical protein
MVLPSKEDFNFKECKFGRDLCWLITPKLQGVKWTKQNSRFRSAIVRQFDNLVISQGFRKFTNFGEQPLFEPWDDSFWPCEARLKLDGSLFIVSKFNGELIIRTRGSVDTSSMKNAEELPELIAKYPKAFDNELLNTQCYSILFEWTSPKNIIVLKEHDEPTLTLIGVTDHLTAAYPTQDFLDAFAEHIEVGRPQKFTFDSFAAVCENVKGWQDAEGVVLFSSDYQTLKKIKADRYCYLHKLASGFSTINGVLDAYLSAPELYATVNEFFKYIEDTADFEIASSNVGLITEVIEARNRAYAKKAAAETYVKKQLPPTLSIAERAKMITAKFSNDQYSRAFAFNAMHGKHNDVLKKTIIAEAKGYE